MLEITRSGLFGLICILLEVYKINWWPGIYFFLFILAFNGGSPCNSCLFSSIRILLFFCSNKLSPGMYEFYVLMNCSWWTLSPYGRLSFPDIGRPGTTLKPLSLYPFPMSKLPFEDTILSIFLAVFV